MPGSLPAPQQRRARLKSRSTPSKPVSRLRQIREYHRQRQDEARAEAARLYIAAQAEGTSFDPAANGFDFSIREIESYVERTHGLKSVFESLAHGQSGLNRLAKAA